MFPYSQPDRVGRTIKNGVTISTVRAFDTGRFETAVSHELYNDYDWIIVEVYVDEVSAEQGHEKWVNTLIDKSYDELPDHLENVGQDFFNSLNNEMFGSIYPKKEA